MSLPPPCGCCCKMTVNIQQAPPSGIDNPFPPNIDVSVPDCCSATQPDLLIATIDLKRDCLCDNKILMGWDGSKWSSNFAGLPGNRVAAECCDGFRVNLDLFCTVSDGMLETCNPGLFRLDTDFSDPQNVCLDCSACASGCPSGTLLGLSFTFFPLDNECCDCCFDVTVTETGGPFFTNDLVCCTGRASLPIRLQISNPLGGCSCVTNSVTAVYNGNGVWGGSFSDGGESCCGQGKGFSVSVKCCERGEVACGGSCNDGKFELEWKFADNCDSLPSRKKCVIPTCPGPDGKISATFNNICFDGNCCESCSCIGLADKLTGNVTVVNVPGSSFTGVCPMDCEADCSGPFTLHRKPNIEQNCVWKGIFISGTGCVGVGTPIEFQGILTLFRCKADVIELGGSLDGNVVTDACGKFEMIIGGGSCPAAHTRALAGSCSGLVDENFGGLDFDSCCQTAVCIASGTITIMA